MILQMRKKEQRTSVLRVAPCDEHGTSHEDVGGDIDGIRDGGAALEKASSHAAMMVVIAMLLANTQAIAPATKQLCFWRWQWWKSWWC